MENKLSVKQLLSYSWQVFKNNPVQHILVVLAASVVQQLGSFLSRFIFAQMGDNVTWLLVADLVDFLTFGAAVGMFMLAYAIVQARKSEMGPKEVVKSILNFDMWWKYVVAILVTYALVAVGLVLLIVPGIILAIGFMFAGYLVVDEKLQPIEAIKKSWSITNGHKAQLFVIGIVFGLLNLLGFLLFLVGLLVTIPVTVFALARAYDILAGNARADAEFAQTDENVEQNDDEDEETAGEEEPEDFEEANTDEADVENTEGR